MSEIRPFRTLGGEYTLYRPDLDETYHSRDGAVDESLYVFIEQGLNRLPDDLDLRILEVGLGTGLNAWLTALEVEAGTRSIQYDALEPVPVDPRLAEQLGYPDRFGNGGELFRAIHSCAWGQVVRLSPNFGIHKIMGTLENSLLESNAYHLIYFDAFGPKKQPELWTFSQLERIVHSMRSGAVFTTYSAAGHLKRDLRALGLSVESPPGPHKKREMTVAIKP